MKNINSYIILWLTLILTNLTAYAKGHTPPLTDDNAVRAIIGEAANQGDRGMLAVACVIRNRGSLQGVFGVNAKHVDKQPQWVWDQARKAWDESAKNDITGGSTHWENVKAFGQPPWAKKMVKTVQIKDHQFYKPARS